MNAALDIIAALLILTGSSVVGLAGLGLVKLPDPFTRMHAATKAGVVGSGMVMLGVALSLGTISAIITGGLGVLFLLATSPIASHALGRAAYTSGAPIAPSTVADALSGVLPRNVFDIAPSRTARTAARQSARQPASRNRGDQPGDDLDTEGEPAMTYSRMNAGHAKTGHGSASTITAWRDASGHHRPTPAALKSVTAWLVGGPHQGDASRLAMIMAREAGARLVGLSVPDFAAADPRGAVPIGGLAWGKWLGDQRRARMRERSAKAIAEFETLSAELGSMAALRHEESGIAGVLPVAAGADLIISPAGVDRIGEPALGDDEVATMLANARLAPVLRVRRLPLQVRRVAVVVSNTASCGRLAQALLRPGLWRDAEIVVIPVGVHREPVRHLAEEQAALLESHGYAVRRADEIDLEADRDAILGRCRGMDAVVLGALSHRRGWFGAVREDIHELFAAETPLVLLP